MKKTIIVLAILATLLMGNLFLTPALASDVTITDNSSMGLVLTSPDLTALAVGLTALSTAINSGVAALILIFEVLLVLGVFAFALWKKDVIFSIVAGLIMSFSALSWIPTYPQISAPLFGLGLYQLGQGVLSAMGTSPSKGASQFKVLLGRVKGWF